MTVADVKKLLNEVLEKLEYEDDDRKVKTATNTYFLRGSSLYLATRSCFIDLDGIDEYYDEDDEW